MRILNGASALLLLGAVIASVAQAKSSNRQDTNGAATSAEGATISPRWGFWAKLAGSSFQNPETGTVNSFYWVEPNKTLAFESLSSRGLTTGKFTLDQREGMTLTQGQRVAKGVADVDGTYAFLEALPFRTRYSFDGRLLIATEKLENGRWGKVNSISVLRRLTLDEIASAKQRAMASYQAEQAKPAQSAKLSGSSVDWIAGTTAMPSPRGFRGRMVQLPVDSVVPVTLTKSDQGVGWSGFRRICIPLPGPEGGPFTLTVNGSGRLLAGQSSECYNAGYADKTGRIVLRFRARKSHPYLEVMAQTGTSLELTLHRVRPEEVAQWESDVRQQLIAERKREASSGSSGFLGVLQGALAGAAGMASGGGGMDAAIAGAAAGAVAGASGADASTIGSAFAQGAYEVNASNAVIQRQLERGVARGSSNTSPATTAAIAFGSSANSYAVAPSSGTTDTPPTQIASPDASSSQATQGQCSYTDKVLTKSIAPGYDLVAENVSSCTYDPSKDPERNRTKSQGASKVSGQ